MIRIYATYQNYGEKGSSTAKKEFDDTHMFEAQTIFDDMKTNPEKHRLNGMKLIRLRMFKVQELAEWDNEDRGMGS